MKRLLFPTLLLLPLALILSNCGKKETGQKEPSSTGQRSIASVPEGATEVEIDPVVGHSSSSNVPVKVAPPPEIDPVPPTQVPAPPPGVVPPPSPDKPLVDTSVAPPGSPAQPGTVLGQIRKVFYDKGFTKIQQGYYFIYNFNLFNQPGEPSCKKYLGFIQYCNNSAPPSKGRFNRFGNSTGDISHEWGSSEDAIRNRFIAIVDSAKSYQVHSSVSFDIIDGLGNTYGFNLQYPLFANPIFKLPPKGAAETDTGNSYMFASPFYYSPTRPQVQLNTSEGSASGGPTAMP
jgi:hypothetical protein